MTVEIEAEGEKIEGAKKRAGRHGGDLSVVLLARIMKDLERARTDAA